MKANERRLLVAGVVTGALVGTSLAMSLAPPDGTRERLRSLARAAREREALETPTRGQT